MKKDYRPMRWHEFKIMTWNERNDYIGFLRTNYKATCTAIAEMLGVSCGNLSAHCKANNYDHKFNRVVSMTDKEKEMFKKFCEPIEVTKEFPLNKKWEFFKSCEHDIRKDYLTEMRDAGYTLKDIGAALGVSGNTLAFHNRKFEQVRFNKASRRKGDAPDFEEWVIIRNKNKHSHNHETQTTLSAISNKDSKSKVIQIHKKEKSGWVCADNAQPEEAGEYACICIVGVNGVPQRSRSFIKYDGFRWMVSGSEIVTHWFAIPEYPEQLAG